VGKATLVAPNIAASERVFQDDDLLPAGNGFSNTSQEGLEISDDNQLDNEEIIIPQSSLKDPV